MESPDLAVCMNNLILLEIQHTDSMADKIARKEGHRQVFIEYLNEITNNSRVPTP